MCSVHSWRHLARPCWEFPYIKHFHHSLNFASITRLMNGMSFTSFTRLTIWQLVLFSSIRLIFELDISSFYLSRYWIVIAGYLSMDFKCSSMHEFSHPLLGQICFRFYLIHWLDEYTLSLFFALSLFQGKFIGVTFLRPKTLFVLGFEPHCGWSYGD